MSDMAIVLVQLNYGGYDTRLMDFCSTSLAFIQTNVFASVHLFIME